MNRYLALGLLLLLLPSVLAAQPDPNAGPAQPPPPPPNRPVDMMPGRFGFNPRTVAAEATPRGLFLLADGVLARYSPGLAQCVTLQLLPPLPPLPPEGNDRQAQQQWFTERALRGTPAAMLPAGEMLYVVYAGILFRVNQNTLTVEKTPLDPQPPHEDPRRLQNASTPPLLKLQADTLYIIRQFDLLAVDVQAGAVITHADLPREMAPPVPMLRGNLNGMELQPPPGAGGVAQAITVVGILAIRNENERMVCILKDDAGVLYRLVGEQTDRLAAQGNLDGKRARVTGVPEGRGAPADVNSILRVQAIQVLGE